MIARLPSVVILVWVTVAVAPLLTLLVAFSAGLVFTVVATFAIVAKSAHGEHEQFEQDRRRAMREAAMRAEIREHRRTSTDWGWPR
jgi:ABC-type nickel/cobalt efflux system permease component RcnA